MIKNLFPILLSLFLLCTRADAAVIAHAFAEVNTVQTKTGDTNFSDISGAEITSGNFIAGKKYLIYVTAQISVSVSDTTLARVQVLHGTTAFEDDSSNIHWKNLWVGTPTRTTYQWWTVWTAVSGEGIKVQHAILNAADTVSTNFVSIFAMNLSDDLTEDTGSGGDWKYAERTNDDTLTTSPTDGASITFTPAIASQDWLILSLARIDHELGSTSITTTMDRSGEATSTTPSIVHVFPSASDGFIYSMGRVFNLGNASNTFKEISVASAASGHVRRHSKIFALNLNKFKNHASAYTEAAFGGLSATNYASQIQTISITPDVQSNVWIGAFWNFDLQDTGREGEFRVQVDNNDQPAGGTEQTTANYQFRQYFSAGDEDALNLSTMVTNMTAATHTIDLDASADSTTGAPDAKHRSLWAITMELAAGAPPTTRRRLTTFGVGQ